MEVHSSLPSDSCSARMESSIPSGIVTVTTVSPPSASVIDKIRSVSTNFIDNNYNMQYDIIYSEISHLFASDKEEERSNVTLE